MADDRQLAADVLDAIGGKGNVSFATHCMTRLRFNLRDGSVPDDAAIKAIPGVLGVARTGGQYQVVVGQRVPKVYAEVCALGDFDAKERVEEEPDDVGDSREGRSLILSLKGVGQAILDYLSGSMVPIVPAIMIAGLFKTFQVVLGPTMLGLVSESGDFYRFTEIVYGAGFYFLPVYLGYTAASKLGSRPILGMLLAGILIEPSFVQLADDGVETLSVFGLSATVVNYSQSVMPILLSVWVMSYVERFFTRVIPDTLSTVFVPFFTMLVVTPVTLVVTAPAGSMLGEAIGNLLFSVGTAGGIASVIAIMLLMALQPFLVITGMHVALIALALAAYAQNGVDTFAIVCNLLSNFAVWAIGLAGFLRLKNPKDKGEALGCFVSGFLGGVTEPTLFGIGFKYTRCLGCMAVANAVVGLFAGVFHVHFYNMGASSILSLLNFVSADNPRNVVFAAIAGGIGIVLSTVLCYFFGFTKAQIAGERAA